MSHLRLARWIALAAGAALGAVGLIHDAVNLPSLNRASARGEIAERLLAQLMANVAFGGLALSLLGAVLVLIASDLGKGKETAWRIGVTIGMFFVLCGLAAYLWLPKAGVLFLSAIGAAVCGPLLRWRREFVAE